MTKLPDLIRGGQVEVPDLLCGGTPCQAFSVAGLRQSLSDERGNLSLTFCEIADAIDEQRKSIIFWENVPGVLNTKDNAFGCFLAGLAGEDEALVPPGGRWTNAGFVDGPKRAVAWRVLDAQYFGVAQRRRRVFVVASARADFDPAAVLFEFDGVRRDSAPSREAGQAVAGTIAARFGISRVGFNCEDQWFISMCLNAGAMGRLDAESETLLPVTVTIDAADGRKWGSNQWVNQGKAIVQPISIHPHCIGRSPEAGPQGKEYLLDGSAYCMDSRGQPQAVAHIVNGNSTPETATEMAFPLRADDGSGNRQALQHGMQVRRLTPTECERLQGFPDNYTNIKDKCPDGPRYKALGNSWAVPVVRWIGQRIVRALV